MDATPTNNSAAPSTPAAQPDDSQSSTASGADSGNFVDKSVLFAELGLPPAAQGADAQTDDEEQPSDSAPADEAGETSPEDSAAGAESEQTETAESDEAATDSGESDESQDSKAEGEKPAEAKVEKTELQQRIDTLTARAKGAEEQLAHAREQLSAIKAQQGGELGGSALEAVEDMGELQGQRDRFLFLHQWALENPDGGRMPGKDGKELEFTREEVSKLQAQTFRLLNKDVPQRAQYLAQRQAADSAAVNSYPWLKDVSKGYGAEVQGAIEQLPTLRTIPNYRLIAANALVGEKLRSAGIVVNDALIERLKKEHAAKGKAPAAAAAQRPPVKAPPSPQRAGTVPARVAPKAAQQKVASQRMHESGGSEDSLAESIAAKLR